MLKLSDEFGAYRLRITCNRCNHAKICDPADVAIKVGWDYALDDLSRRLKCAKCGLKGARIDVVEAVHQREQKWH